MAGILVRYYLSTGNEIDDEINKDLIDSVNDV